MRKPSALSEARRYTPRGRTVRDVGQDWPPPRRGGAAPVPPPARRTQSRKTRSTAGAGRSQPAAARTGAPPRRKATGAGRPVRRPARPAAPPRPPRLADGRRRLRLATVIAMVMFTLIGLRLVELQLTDSHSLAARGLEARLADVVLPAPRGAIYDRDGAVLARSVEARLVYADPTLADDPSKGAYPQKIAAQLSPLLGIPASDLVPLLRRHKRPGGGWSQFEYLARGIDTSDARAVEALNLPGVRTLRDERRDVPGNDLAANVIGFTSTDLNGLEGLEARYDDLLRGVDGKRTFEIGRGDLDKEIPGGYHSETPPRPGSSLQLTIDRDLQYYAQRALYNAMKKVKADWSTAVVLDAHNGEVLAQASYPTYNAADPTNPATKPTDRQDVATAMVADPGSSHKPITLAAALQEGVIKPNSTIPVTPCVTRAEVPRCDSHPFPSGTKITLPGLLAYSSNVGAIKVGDMLGAEKLYEYQRKFGLGSPTGEGVPGEASGLVQPPQNWSGSSSVSIPIGLGVAVTPLQLAAAYAAIANDGTWVQPHLVRATIAPGGKSTPAAAPTTRPVISPANAAALRTMMEAVVSVDGATGKTAAIRGYRVAGKTGTGQQVVNGRYAPGEVASFVGMAPADSPRFVIAVFAHTPGGGGGALAGPVFRDIMQFALAHYRVPPTGTKTPDFKISS
jgi:cell division protein FtsI (penicillin-binding protein 3)